jgi:hypothetical protein
MTLEERSIRRQKVISDFRASGQTAAAWCSENNININTLRSWLTKCSREAKVDQEQEKFIEFKQPAVKEVPIIIKIGAVSIELYSGFHRETLREAIAAIRSL